MTGMEMAMARRVGGKITGLCTGRNRARLRSFLIMAVCSRARIGPGLAPLAAAYLSAGMRREDELPWMLAGCALGSFITGFDGASLYAPAGCAVVMLVQLAFEFVAARLKNLRMDEHSRASLAAGLAVLLPGLAAAGYDPAGWLISLGASVTAAVTAPIMVSGYNRARRAMYACAAGAAVLCAKGMGIPPGPIAAFCTLLFSACGLGAPAGAALGALCMNAGDVAAMCVMGACADGVAALTHNHERPGARIDMCAVKRSAAAMAAYTISAALFGTKLELWVCMAVAAHAFTPPNIISGVRTAFLRPARLDGRLMQALRGRDERRLRALSDAFGSLSAACGAGDPAFGEQQLINRMRAALCAGCTRYADCWPGSGSSAVKLFCQLMTSAIECGGSPFRDGEVPPEVMRLCRRGMTVPNRLGSMLADFAAQRHRRIRLMEARRMIAGQFSQASEVLNAMAAEHARPFIMRDGAAANVKAALSGAGFPVREVAAVKLDRTEVTVELSSRWNYDTAERAARIISGAMEKRFELSSASGTSAIFVPGGVLQASAVSSSLPADPDQPCGDSCIIRDMGDRMFIALSDGMGSGEAAASESTRVITLMHSLISAGIPRELSVSTVNGVLLSRGGEELFATADMLMIDLDSGLAEFTKLAACRSYIVRAGRVLCVEGGRLPLGILDEVTPAVSTVRLKRGDVVFMMTDGVADVLSDRVLEDLIINTVRAQPRDMAEVVINAAAARAPQRRDDMTAVCVRIL